MLFSLAAAGLHLCASDLATASSRSCRGEQPLPHPLHPLQEFASDTHQIWESFTRVLDSIPYLPPPPAAARAALSPPSRTQQQRELLGEGGGVGTFSTEFVDPATPRGARVGVGLGAGLDARVTSPIAGSSSGMIGMQPAYMLMQMGGGVGAAAFSDAEGKEETLDLSRRGLRSGINGGGRAFTRAIREFRYECTLCHRCIAFCSHPV
jgi:hypothetical protein